MHKNTRRLSTLAVAVIGLIAAGQAGASGFQLRENSVKNIGRAYAGSTVASDGSSVYNNPAAMVNANGNLFQADVAGIDLTAKFSGSASFPTPLGPQPISGGNGGDPGSLTAVPAMSAIFKMKGALEGLTLGVGVDAPYGLKTEYEKGWIGRYNATVSSVKAVDLTLSAAVQVTPMLSAGIGLVYERIDVTLGKDIPLSAILVGGLCSNPQSPCPPAQAGALAATPDGNSTLKGKDNAVGFIAGLQLKPSDTFTIGYAHRSAIRHHIDGNAAFTTPGQFQGMQPGFRLLSTNPALPAAQRAGLAVLGNGFVDAKGRASVSTPSTDTLSVDWKVSDRVNLYGEVQQTGWSSLKSVDISFSNPYQPQSSEAFNWKDSTFASIGVDYKLNDAFTLRGGVGFDKTPTNNTDRTPRLPDNDRTLFSVGGTWNATKALSVDAGYTRVEIKSPTVNLSANAAAGRYNNLTGSFKGHADVFGFAASYKF
ncbi:OmpP1/FadL family transporter [Solilutibacter silvestris]|uniref:Long-chain fatty acid transport protein n=1 Tax=Solilutibacter silvestris TaxID=1645665 RepID=A0A2K1Q1I5_9GAMM|nr:outer membrane protein transport protein [Lysobacter silvestris]PNS08909.1 Long-chain fatty acid transport protein [Lysobacter silvestris]